MLRNFTIMKVSVNRLYVNVTLRKLRWRQLAPAQVHLWLSCQQKKQAIELTHEWLVNFDLNSLLHIGLWSRSRWSRMFSAGVGVGFSKMLESESGVGFLKLL